MTGFMLLVMILNSISPQDSGWVVCIATVDSETVAAELTGELNEYYGGLVDYLYMPDWESLSGYQGWMVFSDIFDDPDEASSWAYDFLYRFHDVYVLWLGHGAPREIREVKPQRFWDLAGMMPPWPDPSSDSRLELVQVENPQEESFESTAPELWKLSIPGWEMTGCRDAYFGMVEERAYRTGEYDPETEYQWASSLLKEHAEDLGLSVYEDFESITLVHQLPDPQLRESDADIWVALRSDTLEYGTRLRLFYGSYPEIWNNIPPQWHKSFEPEIVSNPDEAMDLLITALIWSGAYSEQQLENVSFSIEWLDNLGENDYRDYFDIALREIHQPGGQGDTSTAPVIDRFRVYNRGEIIWFAMPQGMFMPFEECLKECK